MLVAAQAATLVGIPIAHLHGGELTSGSTDEGMRHAISKLAHIHLAAAPEYSRRLLQLGEDPEHVHTVGAPGLIGISTEGASLASLEAAVRMDLSGGFVMSDVPPCDRFP